MWKRKAKNLRAIMAAAAFRADNRSHPSETIETSDNEVPTEIITRLFIEDDTNDDKTKSRKISIKVKKKKKQPHTKDGNVEIVCDICGTQTTLRDYDQHEKTEKHQYHRKLLKQNERKARKQRAKANKRKKFSESEDIQALSLPARSLSTIGKETHIREKYNIRHGDPLPQHHQEYIDTLTVFLSLRYLFETHKNFKISTVNAKWNEFGDVVIEIGNFPEITEIQAIQCKQVQYRNSILISFLSAEMGKFSLKTRGEILKKLQRKSDFEKAYFKLYTVSNLIINRDTFSSFYYNSDVVATWKNDAEKQSWINREVEVSECKKLNFFNTTDESDDIYTFRLKNCNDQEMESVLSKYSMLTSQRKLESLKHLIKIMLKNKFDNIRDSISNDLIRFVSDNFKTKHTTSFKLTKRDFLLKLAHLLLEPYSFCPETSDEEKELELWNKMIQSFDVTIIKNDPNIVRRIYTGTDYLLKQETQYSLDEFENLKIEKSKIRNEALCLELFDGYHCDDCTLSWPDTYLATWKAKLTPLLLKAENENDLSLINKVMDFLKEHSVDVKFMVLIENFKVERNMFSKSLNVFLNLEDLKNKNNDCLSEISRKIEINFLNFSLLLKDIVEYNEDFLEKITPDGLLNMFWKDYSFQVSSVPMTNDIGENTLVLRDDLIENISAHFQTDDSDSDTEALSYVISSRGKVMEIFVPSDI